MEYRSTPGKYFGSHSLVILNFSHTSSRNFKKANLAGDRILTSEEAVTKLWRETVKFSCWIKTWKTFIKECKSLLGIRCCSYCSKTIVKVIQIFQNKVYRDIVNAPWSKRNQDLHHDLIAGVKEEIKKFPESGEKTYK